jgi:hypothetical protein
MKDIYWKELKLYGNIKRKREKKIGRRSLSKVKK